MAQLLHEVKRAKDALFGKLVFKALDPRKALRKGASYAQAIGGASKAGGKAGGASGAGSGGAGSGCAGSGGAGSGGRGPTVTRAEFHQCALPILSPLLRSVLRQVTTCSSLVCAGRSGRENKIKFISRHLQRTHSRPHNSPRLLACSNFPFLILLPSLLTLNCCYC